MTTSTYYTNSSINSDSPKINDEALPLVEIYTDGAAIPNPGSGGIGVVLVYGNHRKELSEYIGHCTNNAAEIQAAITALMHLKTRCRVTLYSDSEYLVRTMRGEYRRKTNMDLWTDLDFAALKHEVVWEWVPGHAGDPLNERANTLANSAAQRKDYAK